MRNLQAVVELGARRALHTMIRPQNLRPIGERDGLERAPAGMRRCKRVVAGRVPILRQHHVAETSRDAIDDRHDVVPIGDGKLAARTEVVLDVHDQQDVAVSDGGGHNCARGWQTSPGRKMRLTRPATYTMCAARGMAQGPQPVPIACSRNPPPAKRRDFSIHRGTRTHPMGSPIKALAEIVIAPQRPTRRAIGRVSDR